jgi:catechol 2,3-dioxygenase-like lactoylglutathione lyase family enzyme
LLLGQRQVAEAGMVGAKSTDAAANGQPPRERQLFSFLRAMKPNFKRLDHVQICIPPGAEAAAREFYGGLLGLTEIEKPAVLRANGGMWFQIADIQLHIGVEAEQSKSKRHPAFEVEQVEAVRAYLEAHGVSTRDEPRLSGITRFSFFDPFDNRIELLAKTNDGQPDDNN